MRITHKVGAVCFLVYWIGIIIFTKFYPDELKSIIERLATKFSTSQVLVAAVILFFLPIYFMILHFLGPRLRDRKARQALERLRAVPESGGGAPAFVQRSAV